MKFKNPFLDLTRFEKILWLSSMCIIIATFFIFGKIDILTVIDSLIGVTALIFVAKGRVLGQVLTVIFALFYGIISFFFKYYGEMITYLCMTTPIAVFSVISWLRHPYEGTKEVEVNKLSTKQIFVVSILTVLVTFIFYFILRGLGNANLVWSTVSIATSFLASSLTLLRSPYYAVAYAANDLVLIVLWTLAVIEDISYIPMVICFILFFVNDIYGFYNWRQMKKRQNLKK